ncbi:hypothetical protein SLNWT_5669 [Streptomyces albus]|uniref:Uncharacterized protein n=1 Tax=Streptomyces albus (strain ATCC 21838 / DSM 41398 / FERM P-419 / JCM 4703 / NBRC 107858) TaxID=1081613 RepID=A0A0B5F373_STRA4|nr:hypothetical protein SLNWT_5669 [Streptomyces albus]AOU80346.1 hypothetical protein SLNHY_5655 [Streptomyces albus]
MSAGGAGGAGGAACGVVVHVMTLGLSSIGRHATTVSGESALAGSA